MNILLAVTGSISAYKAYDLLRLLIKDGHTVKIILSSGAQKFIKKETFKYLGAESVHTSSDDFSGEYKILHIELADWADRFVIAPTSANTIAKLSNASADDLTSSVFLAFDSQKPIFIFPAMNTKMLTHPFLQENLEKLKKLKNIFLGQTQFGELACNHIGEGKLEDINIISTIITTYNFKYSAKKILISTGATISALDNVRFLTNPSSGKTGFQIARKALELGYKVDVVAGYGATIELDYLKSLPNFNLIKVETHSQMRKEILKNIEKYDAYISSAAISDIEFIHTEGKLKKAKLENFLEIRKTSDILQEVLEVKPDHLRVIGFAAETELTKEMLKEKLNRKPVDFLVGTKVNNGHNSHLQGFGDTTPEYLIMESDNFFYEGQLNKKELANKIFESKLWQ